jgi:hypothetical protein
MSITTTEELIAQLEQFDPKLPVFVWPADSDRGLWSLRAGIDLIEERAFNDDNNHQHRCVVVYQHPRKS